MWPRRGEALSRTIEAEAALADLYVEALNEWVHAARPLVVPTLDGQVINGDPALVAASVPPNPDSVGETGNVWDQISTGLILVGLSSLWSISLVEALTEMEIAFPEIPDVDLSNVDIATKVLNAITSTSGVTAADIRQAVARVDADDFLRQARDEFLETRREAVSAAPALMQDKLAAAVRDAGPRPGPQTPGIEVVITNQRAAATAVLTPGSAEVRDVARHQGYQAAGVQNHAVLQAARLSEDAADLEKVWIATIDGKTRPTHFAADGQRAPLTGTFSVGHSALHYPGDLDGPPEEVRNCRCRVGVLAADEEIPDEVDRHTERLDGRDSTARNRQGSQADEIERRKREGTIRAREDEDGIGRTASAAPSEQEYEMTVGKSNKLQHGGEADAITAASGDGGEEQGGETFRTFTDQPLAFVGVETSDGRMLSTAIEFSVRTPPLPMMWVKQTGYGHEDAFTVGVIESASLDGDTIRGSGYWLNTAEADEAFNEASHKVSRPSVDLARTEWMLTDENGNEITEEQWWDMPMDAKVIQTITAAELIGTTMVATPAFGDTMIEFTGEQESRDAALVASAEAAFAPRVYPARMFANPQLTEPTLPTMGEDGRIFGHLACFGACHRSIQSQCVMAPRSRSNYAQFHTSPAVRLDDGTRVPVGRLTVGSGHAPDHVSGQVAAAHYDTAGTCYALVRVGEDEHGIWFSGVAAPWATPEQIEMGMASPLSGDWRDFGQGLELVAALAVNTPGFAVRGREGSDGRPAALVASLGPNPRAVAAPSQALTAADIATIVDAAVRNAHQALALQDAARGLLADAESKVGAPPPPKTANDEIGELLAKVAH